MKQLFSIFLLLTCCLACVPTHPNMSREEARAVMDDVSRRNLAYEPLTERDDTMMQQVVAYYKEYGTANDRMEAYYLLGSVYRDLHEAPKAMEAFLNGISAADTTREDCRYDLLTRLYGQKYNILRNRSMHQMAADTEKEAYKYAMLAKDTLYMVAVQWETLCNYFACGDYLSIADKCWDVLEESKRMGMYAYGAKNLCTCVLANIELGRVEDAQKLLSIYEQHSGLVNPYNHECSFPIYYYAKGRVLAATGQLDSAEYFYRKELEAQDWNNRQTACRGLRLLFEQKGEQDSVCKYATLQCEAVDSDYQAMLSINLQNLHEMYDYSRLQTENKRKELQLQEGRRKTLYIWCALASVIVCGAFLFFYIRSLYRQKRALAELRLERATARLEEQEKSLAALHQELEAAKDAEEHRRLQQEVEQSERETEGQRRAVMESQEELDELRRRARTKSKNLREQYGTTALFQSLLYKARHNGMAAEQDYDDIQKVLTENDTELLARFCKLLPNNTEMELHSFLLLRFGLTKTEAGILTAHSQSAVTNIVTRLYQKVNGRNSTTSAEAFEWLLKI